MHHSQATAKKKCKCCGIEMAVKPGRRSKTYCSNACKQTAYYNRRKDSGNNVVTLSGGVTDNAHCVTIHTLDGTDAEDFTQWEDSAQQEEHDSSTNNALNKTLQMEHHTLSAPNNANEESVTPQAISVMGMEVDKEWFNGLLKTLPEDQQRQLSQMLLETISDAFPDLAEDINVTHSDGENDSYLTSETSQAESGEEGDWCNDTDNDGANYQDGEEGAEGESDEPVDDEEGQDSDQEHGNDANVRTFRLGGNNNGESGSGTSHHSHAHSTATHQRVRVQNRDSSSQHPMDANASRNVRGHLSGYLKRFASPRIRRGLTIWEELSVTIPSFMEEYVLHFAADSGILIHPAGRAKGGLITIHILFHLAEHRRPICRLLDLVLEAEDGMLREEDFMVGGAFASPQEEYHDAIPDDGGEIDYDCFDRSTESVARPQGGRHYVSARDIAIHANAKAVRQALRAGTAGRT